MILSVQYEPLSFRFDRLEAKIRIHHLQGNHQLLIKAWFWYSVHWQIKLFRAFIGVDNQTVFAAPRPQLEESEDRETNMIILCFISICANIVYLQPYNAWWRSMPLGKANSVSSKSETKIPTGIPQNENTIWSHQSQYALNEAVWRAKT